MKLTPKQEKFCLEYINCAGNATEAARRAGYKGNDNQIGQMGFQNLKNPKIQNRIQELKAPSDKAVVLSIEDRRILLAQTIARDLDSEDPAMHNVAVKCLEVLNKMDGLYIMKVDMNVSCNIGNELAERMNRFGR